MESVYKIALCTDEKAFKKIISKLGITPQDEPVWLPEDAGGYTHFIDNGEDRVCIVCIEKQKDYEDAIDIINHESVHIFQQHNNFIQEKNPGDETPAYGIATIASNLRKEYRKLK